MVFPIGTQRLKSTVSHDTTIGLTLVLNWLVTYLRRFPVRDALTGTLAGWLVNVLMTYRLTYFNGEFCVHAIFKKGLI